MGLAAWVNACRSVHDYVSVRLCTSVNSCRSLGVTVRLYGSVNECIISHDCVSGRLCASVNECMYGGCMDSGFCSSSPETYLYLDLFEAGD